MPPAPQKFDYIPRNNMIHAMARGLYELRRTALYAAGIEKFTPWLEIPDAERDDLRVTVEKYLANDVPWVESDPRDPTSADHLVLAEVILVRAIAFAAKWSLDPMPLPYARPLNAIDPVDPASSLPITDRPPADDTFPEVPDGAARADLQALLAAATTADDDAVSADDDHAPAAPPASPVSDVAPVGSTSDDASPWGEPVEFAFPSTEASLEALVEVSPEPPPEVSPEPPEEPGQPVKPAARASRKRRSDVK